MPNIQSILVKLDDGSIWEAKHEDGKLELIREVTPSPPPPKFMGKETMAGKGKNEEESGEPEEKQQEKQERKPYKPIPDSVFRARLASIMTDNMYDRHVRGRTRGKLDLTRLWKGETGATTLFTQKQARKNKKYNVLLLIDESGSMYASEKDILEDRGKYKRARKASDTPKIDVAREVALFLARSFDGLSLNLAVVGFNDFVKVHKGFDEKLNLDLLSEVIELGQGDSYNNDYDAMSYAYQMLNKREGQNILLMLSDGAPVPSPFLMRKLKDPNLVSPKTSKDAMGKRHEIYVDVAAGNINRSDKKNFHKLVAKYPNVTSLGFGIFEGGWQIPDHHVINGLAELKPLVLQELNKHIRRG